MPVRLDALDITSPKRNARNNKGWEGNFPYYAGFPETFAERLISSAKLTSAHRILDPWNGSGTTTFSASRLGIPSEGVDLNPVMAVVARARSLAATEADAIVPIAKEVIARARRLRTPCQAEDPLLIWFGPQTASWFRSIEAAARILLIGDLTISPVGTKFDNLSAIASTFYVALFTLSREVARGFATTNPTWIRNARAGERRASKPATDLDARYLFLLAKMATALSDAPKSKIARAPIGLRVADTTTDLADEALFDMVLTSPPYCTRLDYTAATKMQLAIIWPLMTMTTGDLSRRMTGSIRVPALKQEVDPQWGPACCEFLDAVASHPSKASGGYYWKTHADYFAKIYSSLAGISRTLKDGAIAVFVVQDSHYKEVHNDLPKILGEMGTNHGLSLGRREDFRLNRTLAVRHPHTKSYRQKIDATESVLCFRKISEENKGQRYES